MSKKGILKTFELECHDKTGLLESVGNEKIINF